MDDLGVLEVLWLSSRMPALRERVAGVTKPDVVRLRAAGKFEVCLATGAGAGGEGVVVGLDIGLGRDVAVDVEVGKGLDVEASMNADDGERPVGEDHMADRTMSGAIASRCVTDRPTSVLPE